MASFQSSSKVKVIKDDDHFKQEITLAMDRLVVVDFFATWCGPCKAIAPAVDEFSLKYTQVLFLKVDVDICINTKRFYDIRSMPTFIFIHKGKKLESVLGIDKVALEAGIVKHIGNIPSSEGAGPSTVSVPPGQENLNGLVDKSNSECLNESDDHGFENALSSGSSYLESDCDEQLIISLAFQQPIKLHSLKLIAPDDGRAPKTIKLFINQVTTMDFDTAERMKPLIEINLTSDDFTEDNPYTLPYVKFQNVQRLTIFIKDNQGDCETTVLQYLGLYGGLLNSTDMKEFKRPEIKEKDISKRLRPSAGTF